MVQCFTLTVPAGQTSQISTRRNTNRNNVSFRVVDSAMDIMLTINITSYYNYRITIPANNSDWHHLDTMYSEHIVFCLDLLQPVETDTQFTIEYENVDRKCTSSVRLTDTDGGYISSNNGALKVNVVSMPPINLDPLVQAVRSALAAAPSAALPAPAPAPPAPPAPPLPLLPDNIVIDVPFKDLVVLGSRQLPLATDSNGHLLTKGENYTYSRIYNGILTKGRLTPKVDCRNYTYKCVYCKIENPAADRDQYMLTLHASPNGEDYFVLRQQVIGKNAVFSIDEPIGFLRLQLDDEVNVNIYISMY